MSTCLVVMGVSGCGKSSLAAAVAQVLGLAMVEGDDHHGPANRAKMAAGQPLTDADRAGWLDRLAAELQARPQGAVLSCSALKRAYRDRLRAAVPDVRFIFLDIDRATALARVQGRGGAHFFPAALVESQFTTLERPVDEAGVLALDGTQAPEGLVVAVGAWLATAPDGFGSGRSAVQEVKAPAPSSPPPTPPPGRTRVGCG